VSANKLPALLRWAARTFNLKLPTEKMRVPHRKVNGKMTTVEVERPMAFGKTHAKFLRALMTQLNKLQAAEWMGDLLRDDEASCCYMADGAESLQSEWLAQILSKRDADGKLVLFAIDMAVMDSKTAEAQYARFTEALSEIADAAEAAAEIDAPTAERLRRFKPTCSMNDRAPNARKAARLVLGLEDGDDDPTCAEHGLVNILEEARKAIDAIVRRMMNITDEQVSQLPNPNLNPTTRMVRPSSHGVPAGCRLRAAVYSLLASLPLTLTTLTLALALALTLTHTPTPSAMLS
jgi:hypothetical protein